MFKGEIKPPPILLDVEKELEEYLINPERLPIHEYERNQEHWPREIDVSSLFVYDVSPLSTTLKVQRDYTTGEIVEFCEVPVDCATASAKNSMMLTRAPAAPEDVLFGNISNIPFLPGSFIDPLEQLKYQGETEEKENEDLLIVPPGFEKGLEFDSDGITLKGFRGDNSLKSPASFGDDTNVLDLLDVLDNEQDFSELLNKPEKPEDLSSPQNQSESAALPGEEEALKDIPVLKISEVVPRKIREGTEWAILLDTSKPVDNFKEKIPELAHNFDFELDTFQKLAIMQLEEHNHVFVAAHTSAGKTVVAEYAIALSQKHMSRTIYTSPIKALSNQKYRDFKRTFKDVGLITGDFQINQTASCLIMTTEILRSMLYRGSDIARDLEYVIFDEVHYINDKERGHVWEQVLIMLPPHVCVVLLSATVPNTTEFADWLGRTHQRKVYVIKTDKRPVPLQHYLYTGCGGKTRDNRYLIQAGNGQFVLTGYNNAVESLTPKQEKNANPNKKFPPKKEIYQPSPGYNQKQEKTMWEGLVDHLNKKELLPAVAFTFSRARCDMNAEILRSLDLTTSKEKFYIENFFNKCIASLKETDREIPQVKKMKDTLIRGVGVHHSGILPIIKEMVEMLFQGGFVKLLFATETFAMGVNMPTRTVLFDSIEKHDGRCKRTLLPAEYIQMAGRAGRRRLDDTGTVIIICKREVPPLHVLQTMMMGKPSQLTSQFRLTYGMVLSLLRVESLSVEGMMSKSFREADHEKRKETVKEELQKVEQQLKEKASKELNEYLQPLRKFYEHTSKYLQLKKEVFPELLKSPIVAKEVSPGRVVLITQNIHINKLALILSVTSKPDDQLYRVLVLDDEKSKDEENEKSYQPEEWYKMLAIATDEIFIPASGGTGHVVLNVRSYDISEITSKTIKTDVAVILKDWDERQIPRFKDKPPGQTCSAAVQELYKLSMGTRGMSGAEEKINYLTFLEDLKVKELELVEKVQKLCKLKEIALDHVGSTKIANFKEQFQEVFLRNSLEDRRTLLKCQLSNASLTLYPDYENRIQLLKRLKYVDSQNKVELKGKVACEMGMHELLVTELILRNYLTKLQPPVIAALLSSLVFQAKTREELSLSEELKAGIEIIKDVASEINSLETHYRIRDESNDNELNFGLVQVVYEWATGKPFAEIMELTDVQEGIIVRCIQQLNEIISKVKDAAKCIGDPELKNKMEEASTAIKRDIVFAASLYTQKEAAAI